jgi:hypothetical protein
MMQSEVAKTYCVIPILERLIDITELENFCKEQGLDFSDDVVRGYSFSIVCTLNHIIKRALNAPDTMGLKYEKVLARADYVGLPFNELPYQMATGKFARNLVELYRPFMGIHTWGDFREVSSQVSKFVVEPLRTAFLKGMEELLNDLNGNEHVESALRYAAIWYIDFILLSYQDVRSTYSNAYKRLPIRQMPDSVPVFMGNNRFFYGYKLAMLYLIKTIIGPNYQKSKGLTQINQCDDWDSFDELFGKIEIHKVIPRILGFEQSHYLDSFFKASKIGDSFTLLKNSQLFLELPKTIDKKLDELFMWYDDITMLDVANNPLGFIINLRGYSSFKVKKIYIAKIAHPQEPDQNNYSFAIFIESNGLLNDFSYWLLFYNFATDYSGNGSTVLKGILGEIKKRRKQVEMTEVVVSETDIEKYLENHRIKRLTIENQQLRELNKVIKGRLFEQFVANLLSKMGFSTYVGLRNSSILEDKEIDIIAIKQDRGKVEIIIAETFGSFPLEEQYVKQITEEMKEKLAMVKKNYVKIVSQVSKTKDILSLSSVQLWVVTHDVTKRKLISSNIMIYDINRIIALCNELNINYYPIVRILKKQNDLLGKDFP